MTHADFVARIVGTPWRRWASGWDACDCYGLVVLYYREVAGIDLGDVPHYTLADGFLRTPLADAWRECARPEVGACGFMLFRDGAPTHCGIYIGAGEVLHAHGDEVTRGDVRISRVKSMELLYGPAKYYALDRQ